MRNWANSSGRRGLALGLVAVAAVGVVAWATTMADFEPSSEPPTPTPAPPTIARRRTTPSPSGAPASAPPAAAAAATAMP